MSEAGTVPQPEDRESVPWNGTYVVADEGKQIAVGAQEGEVWIGPSLYADPIWRLDQERAEDFARAFVGFTWEAGRQEATMPP